MPYLIDFHQHLRRVGRNDHHVRMRLHEDASLFLVGLAQVFARLDGFSEAGLQVVGLGDASAICAMTAEIRQAVSDRPLQTVHRFRNHLTERKLPRSRRAGQDQRMRKVFVGQHLPQRVNRFGVTVKVRK